MILWYVFNLHSKIPSLHSVLPWLYSKSNDCTVWYSVCFPFSSSRILIFMYSTFLCCRISLEFCVTGWGLWMIEGKQMCAQPETQEFLSNSLHLLHTAVQCKNTQIQIHLIRPTIQRYRALAVFEGWLSAAHCWGLSCLLLSESGLWEYLSWYKPNDRDGDDADADDNDDDDDDVRMSGTGCPHRADIGRRRPRSILYRRPAANLHLNCHILYYPPITLLWLQYFS